MPERELYGGNPPFEAASDTSYQAALSVKESVENKRARVHRCIAGRGAQGATCDEVEVALAMPHQTAGPRIRELFLLGRILRCQVGGKPLRRPTRTGRNADVWVARAVEPVDAPQHEGGD